MTYSKFSRIDVRIEKWDQDGHPRKAHADLYGEGTELHVDLEGDISDALVTLSSWVYRSEAGS